MKLKRVELENFRQYYGKHILKFANDHQNISLILGENNAGKTGIYRAIVFGLYGDLKLKQDGKSDIKLVNMKALEKANIMSTAFVEVWVEYKGIDYKIKRSIIARKQKNKYIENKGIVNMTYIDKDNNEINIDDEIKIQLKINKMLDKNIKDFFFFDGEHIETLARSDRASRNEVKKGIVKLMDIDKLEKTKKILDSLYRKERSRITEKSNNIKIKEYERSLKINKDKIKTKIEEQEKIEEQIESMESKREKAKYFLEENEDNKRLFAEIADKEMELKNILNKEENLKKQISSYFFKDLSKLLLNNELIDLKEKIEENLAEESSTIPKRIIEQAINEGFCPCCEQDTKIMEVSELLRNKIERFEYSEKVDLSEKIYNDIEYSLEEQQEYIYRLENILSEYEKSKKINKELSEEIKIRNKEITDKSYGERSELSKVQKDYDELKERISMNKVKLAKIKEDIKFLESEKKEFERKYSKELKEEKNLDYEKNRLDKIENLMKKIIDIYDKYINISRDNLGKETTKIFKILIDDEHKSLVDRIIINDKYEMDIIHGKNSIVTQDISQGQQMIAALSFVTALAKLASRGDDKIDYPLFMDTPFSRLSKKNRKNLICNLPKLTNQWIPLLTDTEYTEYEKNIFEATGRVGKEYQINKIDKYESKIIEL